MAAEAKTKATHADVAAFLDAVEPAARRDDAKALNALLAEATGAVATMWGPSIVGFGVRDTVHADGRRTPFLRVGFSPRKASLVLYGVLGAPETEADLARLGRHETGKGCLYVKRLSDVDEAALAALVRRAWNAETLDGC